MTHRSFVIAGALMLATASPVSACEPVLPFLRVAGGVATLGGSLLVLSIAVAVKCLVFGALQRRLSFVRGATFMLLGNLLTTIIGFLAAGLIGAAPVAWLWTTPIVWVLCLPAARRMSCATPASWIGPRRPSILAALMTVMLLSSCFLFLIAQGVIVTNQLALYWALKWIAIYLALLVSIGLTAFWEEWAVWRLSRADATDRVFVAPAIRANLIVFFGIALYGAIVIFPMRMKASDFLVRAPSELIRTTARRLMNDPMVEGRYFFGGRGPTRRSSVTAHATFSLVTEWGFGNEETIVRLARELGRETIMPLQSAAENLCIGSWTYVSNLLRTRYK